MWGRGVECEEKEKEEGEQVRSSVNELRKEFGQGQGVGKQILLYVHKRKTIITYKTTLSFIIDDRSVKVHYRWNLEL